MLLTWSLLYLWLVPDYLWAERIFKFLLLVQIPLEVFVTIAGISLEFGPKVRAEYQARRPSKFLVNLDRLCDFIIILILVGMGQILWSIIYTAFYALMLIRQATLDMPVSTTRRTDD
jgi:hypothetical protein